jgi:hypothetical protein
MSFNARVFFSPALQLDDHTASPSHNITGIMMAMDKADKRSRKERILEKRGALNWLPIHFKNDLVHGSW